MLVCQYGAMPGLFGTDGVRGVANRELTPDLALALGRAAGFSLPGDKKHVVVGRDTRVSGDMLQAALTAGLMSAGVDVHLAGIIPTPAVAWLTVADGARAGAVLSASHNPVPDNGIKFFSEDGFKVAQGLEEEIESAMQEVPNELPEGAGIGSSATLNDASQRYIGHLLATLEHRLEGLTVVLDCAFGAAYEVAPSAFAQAGATVIAINDEPDGTRINVSCGSTSLEGVAQRVLDERADIGLAFDGDADRVLAIDERGGVVDGDRILAISAVALQKEGALPNNVIVATVMSNLGFRRSLEELGIEIVTVPVGDKFVAEAMVSTGAALGGEQSGHVIFGKHATTGDGVLTGLQVASALSSGEAPLSKLAHLFEPYPQVLINVPVKARERLESATGLWDEIADAERQLGAEGRVLVRPSGTEPVVRVMVEAAAESDAQRIADRLVTSVERHLGA